jgi:hypothetical protein
VAGITKGHRGSTAPEEVAPGGSGISWQRFGDEQSPRGRILGAPGHGRAEDSLAQYAGFLGTLIISRHAALGYGAQVRRAGRHAKFYTQPGVHR